jgi:polyisoprenoid-binding protein YceI
MRRIYIPFVAFCLGFLVAGAASADSYEIDPAHTQVIFKVRHLGITTVTGTFGTFSGAFDFDPADFETASVSAAIDVASIDTGVEARDNHLRTSDFFDVENHPEITFKSTKVQNIEGKSFELVGDLTMRGVTKPVTLDIEFVGTATDPYENEKAAFTASTEINRMDFGVSWGAVLETGGLVVSEEVRILLEVQGTKKK